MGNYTDNICWRSKEYEVASVSTAVDLCVGVDDMDHVERLSGGKVDLTYGSALDIFGGSLVKFTELVERDKRGP